jgi:molybdopterin-binding protein
LQIFRVASVAALFLAQISQRDADFGNAFLKFDFVLVLLRADYNGLMTISARNRLKGTVEEVVLGTVMAHVVMRVGDNVIESAITRRSADEMKLKKGDTVTAVIKSTEVMIQKD